jgi:diaminohydroxyphosphoribosylaminopyrimidine deaminase / 5-amino-6-(5-phosphoribosylamino)uracil reductase
LTSISHIEDKRFMRMAIDYSRRGLGVSAPNPSVGVVIVKNGVVVGRGVTAAGGRPHAERIALNQAGDLAKGATLYVTLEPCAKRSQIGAVACTDAVIEAGIARVVIGASDPSPLAAGQGAARLLVHGIEVVSGVEEAAARHVNLGHILRVSQNRPMVTLKLAQTADGFAGGLNNTPLAITGEETRSYVHMMRAQSDAIAVGISTVLADDPMLDVRLAGLEHRSPVRVVFDTHLRLPLGSKLVKTARDIPVWVIAGLDAPAYNERELVQAGVEVMRVAPHDLHTSLDLHAALGLVATRGITRLMLEGGPTLAEAFAAQCLINGQGFVDEIALFTAPWSARCGVKAIGASLEALLKRSHADCIAVGDDKLQRFQIGDK